MPIIDTQKRNLFRRKSELVINNLMPWIVDATKFTENCTQCQNCLNSCPENIIVQGDGGFPVIDFSAGECTFCTKCAVSCQEDIFADTSEIAWQKKAVISESCLANQNVYCRSCCESCPELALSFKIGINAIPEIDLAKCNGCGACFSPCPTSAINIKDSK
ncbi:ferredoxin-type protein NapF [Psychromonas sp. RZ22]|uniref:ferredoxin-type protein NapF n=1 Tax=Psychromonas algarum TaxID=2555643 RepID=UPI001068929E|nr:ferredoxin-type protein NapF [Psychromonas sp. RZ22]TEW56075.1 ferredoxin-type protein NapF [Psychromonas sp. RZ22]